MPCRMLIQIWIWRCWVGADGSGAVGAYFFGHLSGTLELGSFFQAHPAYIQGLVCVLTDDIDNMDTDVMNVQPLANEDLDSDGMGSDGPPHGEGGSEQDDEPEWHVDTDADDMPGEARSASF